MNDLMQNIDEKFITRLKSTEKYSAIEEVAMLFRDTDVCNDIDLLINALKEREGIMSTGIGFSMAIPHVKIKAVNKLAFAIGISAKGIEFDSIDGNPVKLIVMVAAGENQHKEYLLLLSQIMSVLKDEHVRNKIIDSSSNKEIVEVFKN